MDLLSESIEALSPGAVVTGRLELSAPWGFDGPDAAGTFYIVARGVCWLETKAGEALQLAAGDFALLPHGSAHVVRDSRATRAVPFAELDRDGGGGAVTSLVTGSITCEDDQASPLLAALPPRIRLKSDGSRPAFEAALRLLMTVLAADRPGAAIIARHLAVVLLVEAARSEMTKATEGWLHAMADPQIGGAIAMMQNDPGAEWTVESLAARASMSRAAFAARFHHFAGEPPLAWLTRWRMQTAARELRRTARPISEIARTLSYDSEAAFNKAFKRIMGVTPGRYRRGATADSPPVRRRRRTTAPATRRKPEPEKKRDWSFID